MENLKKFEKLMEYKKENENITIAVAMSGGVDSSVTAYLLKKQGYKIFGVTMKTTDDDIDEDARKVCEDLGIEHFVYDVSKEFYDKVIKYFLDEYKNGRTPNPCMVCNKHIKMGALVDFALEKGADFMATGHYSNINNGVLRIGDDLSKDQAYFLSQAKKEKLKHIIFPIGNIEKTEVRELGKLLGVRVYSKKDSQEICFVEDGKLEEFLFKNIDKNIGVPGKFVDTKGNVLGKHKGLAFYTIGQRKGLGISGDAPYYVLKLDSEHNEIILGTNEELFKTSLVGENINLLTINTIEELDGVEYFAKTRSRDKFHRCIVKVLDKDSIEVNFLDGGVRAVTPGQGVVLYDDSYSVVASGFIK